MTKIKLQFSGTYKRYTDSNKELTSSYTYRNSVLIPKEKVDDLSYIGNAILSEMYHRPSNEDFKDKIILVEGVITFDVPVNEWPELYGKWIRVTAIEQVGSSLTGSTEIFHKNLI